MLRHPAAPIAVACLLAAPFAGCGEEPVPGDDDTTAADDDTGPEEWPPIETGSLVAGAASGTLDLPVGIPLGGYTGRDGYLGNDPGPDNRDSPYVTDFVPSGGVQTRAPAHAVWLEAGSQSALLLKADLIYPFDGMVTALEEKFAARTGVEVRDRLMLSTSHSHSSYGTFSQALYLFFGTDGFNREVFERMTDQLADLAAAAWKGRVAAAIGVGFDEEFDPIGVDEIFRDRRGENDLLPDPWGQPTGPGFKDPRLTVLRIDRSQGTSDPGDDTPLALLFHFGVHGTVMGGDNPLVTSETTGHIELKLRDRLPPGVVNLHLQGAAGDVSPAGEQGDFARMEWLGEKAAPKVLALWQETPTTTDPVSLEAVVRSVDQGRDITVSRNGAVDWYYLPYQEDFVPDSEIWEADGVTPRSPFDEFRAEYGAALCGTEDIEIPFLGMGVSTPPYTSCLDMSNAGALLSVVFRYPEEELTYPLQETRKTMLGALRIGPVPIHDFGGDTVSDDFVAAFFPGEPLTLFSLDFRKRLEEEVGFPHAIVVGYSQDEEGYLCGTEDWLQGGYEPGINIWGPIQGDFLIERMLDLTGLLLTRDVAEDPTWPDFSDEQYALWDLVPAVPDPGVQGGTVPDVVPAYLYSRDGWIPSSPQPDPVVPRVTGIASFVWRGGDAVLGLPRVSLEREQTPGAGDFVPATLPGGQPLDDSGYDMILTYTPDPLTDPYDDFDRVHYWLVEWQAVTDRPSLEWSASVPAGMWRFHVEGRVADPAETGHPYLGTPYELWSEPFEVVPSPLVVEATAVSPTEVVLNVSYGAPARGFRLLDMDADFRGPTPIEGGDGTPAVQVTLLSATDGTVLDGQAVTAVRGGTYSVVTLSGLDLSPGNATVTVVDGFGNSGEVAVVVP